MKISSWLLSILLLVTAGCGDDSTSADPASCFCEAGCESGESSDLDPGVACGADETVDLKGLLARALLTQAAYQNPQTPDQDPDDGKPPYYQLQWREGCPKWNEPCKFTFFSGPPQRVEEQLNRILGELGYEITGRVEFLNLGQNDKLASQQDFRAFTTTMRELPDGDEYFVISIRGTLFLAVDVEIDISGNTPTQGPVPQSMVVKSFYDSYKKHLKREIDRAVSESSQRRIHVLGHSLGGAYAALAAQDLASRSNPPEIKLYTYNSPRVGDRKFADWLNRRLPENIRHTTSLDLISTLPAKSDSWKPYHTGVSYVTEITLGSREEGSQSIPSVGVVRTDKLGRGDPGTKSAAEQAANDKGPLGVIDAHLYFAFGADKETLNPTERDIPFLNRPGPQ